MFILIKSNSALSISLSLLILRYVVLNRLNGSIPKELGALTTLTKFTSIANFLSGTIPSQLSTLTNLKEFYMGVSFITGTIPDWIWLDDFDKLHLFYMSDNLLTGTLFPLSDGITTAAAGATTTVSSSRLGQITSFSADDNQLEGSLNIIWKMPNLKIAYLEENDFTGTMPLSIVSTNPKLDELDISENRVRGELPIDWYLLTDLRIFDVHGNNLSGTIPSSSSTPSSLSSSSPRNSIVMNNIMNPNHNSKLLFLGLQSCRLTGTIPKSLSNDVPSLLHLDIANNQLTGNIPEELAGFGNNQLMRLFLGDNNFAPGPIPTFIYTQMTNLFELSLRNTARTGTVPTSLSQMTNLILLDLSRNDLEAKFPGEITSNMLDMQVLILQHNAFSGPLPSLGRMGKLRKFLITHYSARLVSFCQLQCNCLLRLKKRIRMRHFISCTTVTPIFSGTLPLFLSTNYSKIGNI